MQLIGPSSARDASILGSLKLGVKIGALTQYFSSMTARLAQTMEERKRTAEKVRSSEVFLNNIVENIPDMIFVKDAEDLRFVLFNKAGERLLGQSRDDLIGKNDYDFFPKLEADFFTGKDREVLLAKQTVDIREESISTAHLGERLLHTKKIPILGDDGRPKYLLGISEDITETKRAEQALAEKNALLEALMNSSVDGILVVDHQGTQVFHNQRMVDLWKIPQAVADNPDDALQVRHVMNATRRPQEFFERVMYLYDHPNEPSWEEVELLDGTFLERWSAPVVGKDGRHYGRVWNFRDITERRRAEEVLRRSEERYHSLVDLLPETVVVHSDGTIMFINEAGARMCGASNPGEIVGKPIKDFVRADLWEQVSARVRSVEELDVPAPFLEHVFLRCDGQPFPVLAAGVQVHCAGKKAVLTIVRDLAELKRVEQEKAKLEAQLFQAQKMESVGRLAGGVAHDFNNLLGVILGNVDLAMEQVGPGMPLYDELVEIQSAAERSADLTRQLLAFARKQPIAPKVLNLNDTVAGMLKMLYRLIGEGTALSWQPKAHLWPVRADPSQIDQILANLCVNARDAAGDIGKLTIETDNVVIDREYCSGHAEVVAGDYVLLAVSDNGCGMDRDTLAHIFEPFFTTKSRGQGTGLGLATVYGAVQQNGGFISVYSEPDHGTTFKIYLPRVTEGVCEEPVVTSAKPLARGQETILLVEDESALLKMSARVIERLGYTVLQACSPNDAMSLAAQHRGVIHLLLTDVVMPGMNGQQLAEQLKVQFPQLKVLFMSGYTANVIAQHGVLDEGVHFIQKPFTSQGLADQVRAILG